MCAELRTACRRRVACRCGPRAPRCWARCSPHCSTAAPRPCACTGPAPLAPRSACPTRAASRSHTVSNVSLAHAAARQRCDPAPAHGICLTYRAHNLTYLPTLAERPKVDLGLLHQKDATPVFGSAIRSLNFVLKKPTTTVFYSSNPHNLLERKCYTSIN